MKKNLLTILTCLIFNFSSAQQYVWQQLNSIPSVPRHGPIGFELNGGIYFGMGQTNSGTAQNDLWNYDPGSNTWSQKAGLPSGVRVGAFSFSVNGYGYVCCGWENTSVQNPKTDLWRYDASSNSWQQKSNFIGSGRYTGSCFVINGIAYLGMGYAPFKSDFYAYNSGSDSWSQIASCPVAAQSCAAFALYGKGYIIAGNTSSVLNGVYQYDPATNFWITKNNFPITTAGAVASVINNVAYVGLGIDQLSPIHETQFFYAYQPFLDYWTLVSTFPSFGRSSAYMIAVGNEGYLFGGNNQAGGNINPTSELWKFTPNVTGIENSSENAYKVFYNSSLDEITFNGINQTNAIIEVFAADGRLLINHQYVLLNKQCSVSTHELSNGIYLYKAADSFGRKIIAGKILVKKR